MPRLGQPTQRRCAGNDNRVMSTAAPHFDVVTDTTPAWADISGSFWRDLGDTYFARVAPQPLPAPHWIARNTPLAQELGCAAWLAGDGQHALAWLAGNVVPPHGALASVYSGHQFGQWAGQLGDGRALLLGELNTPQGRQEVQLKGAGLTPYSRMGDGRAVLRSSVREYLCSEAMHGLGIPTTRALAIVGSALPVRRETLETAAVVTRIAPSFLRFGHFEHFTHTAQDVAALRRLADATLTRFYPDLLTAPNPYTAMLQAVAVRTARLMAQWQCVGFCHGVMNTDNMSMLGLTIDYGPFGFLDAFDPGHICNHTDTQGRYAWARQPNVAFWNLHALAQGLMPLIGESDDALAALEDYKTAFSQALMAQLRAKLGLLEARDEDQALSDDLLKLMAADHVDFTIAWRSLSGFSTAAQAGVAAVRDYFVDRTAFDAWAVRYAERLTSEGSIDAERSARMNKANPKYVLRNHLAEQAIRQATTGDFSEVERLQRLLENPFEEQPGNEADAGLPPDWAAHLEVSCSS